jgi:hypothetical protein
VTDHLVTLLESARYDEATEADLQDGVTRVLSTATVPFEREVRIGRGDQIDFLAGAVGIECKIAGSLASVTRQLHRYALSNRVDALILVTTRLQLARVPDRLNGKPVHVVATMGGVI